MYKKILAITFAVMFLSSIMSVTSGGIMTPAFAVKQNHHKTHLPKLIANVTGISAYQQSVHVSEKFNKIYTISPLSGNVTIIDGKTNQPVDSVFIGNDVNHAVVDDEANKLYVLSSGKSQIITMNTKTNQVIGSPIQIGNPHLPPGCNNFDIPCTDPGSDSYGISMNHKTGTLYVTNIADETVSVVDTKTRAVVDTIPVGVPAYLSSVNEKTNKIYVSGSYDATVVVIDGKTNKVIKSIPTGTPATPDDCYETFTCTDYGSDTYYVVVNEKTNKIYAGNLFDGTLLVIDGKTDKVIGSPISTGDSLSGLAVNHEINTVYAGDYTTDNLYVIDGKSDKIIGSPILIGTPATPLGCKLSLFNCVDYGSGPESIDVNEKTNRIYVSEDVGAVAVLDAKTHHKISEIHLGHGGK